MIVAPKCFAQSPFFVLIFQTGLKIVQYWTDGKEQLEGSKGRRGDIIEMKLKGTDV
jgi:hypothetical protein